MKNPIFVLLTCVITISTYGQNIKALDEKFGFKETKLEMSISSFSNLVLKVTSPDNPNLKMYKVMRADLKIGNYTLDEIDYWFYKDKLQTIEITVTKGYSNQQGLLRVLETAYEKGEYGKTSYGSDKYHWYGEKVEMDYILGDDLEPTGDLQIISKKLLNEESYDSFLLRKQKETDIIKAAKDL
jgi:hypothetical protein